MRQLRRHTENRSRNTVANKERVTYALMAILNVREFGCCQTGESFDCISSSILRDVRHSPAIPQLQTRETEKDEYQNQRERIDAKINVSPVHENRSVLSSRTGSGVSAERWKYVNS